MRHGLERNRLGQHKTGGHGRESVQLESERGWTIRCLERLGRDSRFVNDRRSEKYKIERSPKLRRIHRRFPSAFHWYDV